MVDTRVITIKEKDYCETFTDDKTKKLLQVDTGNIYDSPAIDLIEGFNGNKPYSRFKYGEIDKTEQDYETEKLLEVTENADN